MRKENEKYFFSVEGETEVWYFEHLNKLINDQLERLGADFTVSLDAKKSRPAKYIKSRSFVKKGQELIHVFDHEGDVVRFKKTLDEMTLAKQKDAVYRLGYTNISLELWLLLHKQDCFGNVPNVNAYLPRLNQSFGLNFRNLGELKSEHGFKQLLSKIELTDVYSAVVRAERIHQQRLDSAEQERYKSYAWFNENPSLSLHLCIKKILDFCVERINTLRKEENKMRSKIGMDELPQIGEL